MSSQEFYMFDLRSGSRKAHLQEDKSTTDIQVYRRRTTTTQIQRQRPDAVLVR